MDLPVIYFSLHKFHIAVFSIWPFLLRVQVLRIVMEKMYFYCKLFFSWIQVSTLQSASSYGTQVWLVNLLKSFLQTRLQKDGTNFVSLLTVVLDKLLVWTCTTNNNSRLAFTCYTVQEIKKSHNTKGLNYLNVLVLCQEEHKPGWSGWGCMLSCQ